MLQWAGDLSSVASAAVLPVVEHLDGGLATRFGWSRQQVGCASDVHRAAAHQHTAVSRLRVAPLASRHRDGQALHVLRVEDMKRVAARTMNPRNDSMDPRFGFTVGVGTDRATARIDTDQDRPATGVREGGDGLRDCVLRDALLELEHVRFAGVPRVELVRGQRPVIRVAPLANFSRPAC